MLARAAQGAVEGEWLYADRQTAGRGRLGRSWQSPPGNLHASGLVRLRSVDPPAPTLALVAGIALDETLTAWTGFDGFRLKWPNDLLAGRAKVAGILLERAGDAVVIGVGCNIAHHPDDLDRPVTSLAALGLATPPPGELLVALADAFAHALQRWRSAGLAPIARNWMTHAHARGEALSANLPDGSRIQGSFDGLDETGALRLRLADGATRVIHAGDVFPL